MTEQKEKELQDEISYLRRELQSEKNERIKLAEALDSTLGHLSKVMKERDDFAFRLRKIQAAFDKESGSHNL